MTAYRELATLCQQLEQTSSRLTMRRLIAGFLRRVEPSELEIAVNLIIGRVFPEQDPRSMQMSFASVFRLLGELNLPTEVYRRSYSTAVDAGEAVRMILKHASHKSRRLSIAEVHRQLESIAVSRGRGSRKERDHMFRDLLSQIDEIEAKYVTKSMFGEMRHGASEGIMLDAIAEAASVSSDLVRRAHMFAGELGHVARIALTKGEKGVRDVRIILFRPIKPMLARTANSLEEAWTELGGTLALEYKYDGARVQIHKRGRTVRMYSRRLTDITRAFPELIEQLRKLPAERTLLEGEIVGVDPAGKPLPFQHIMRRVTRVHQVQRAMKKIPIRLHLFDCLMVGDEMLVDSSYEIRWKTLLNTVPADLVASRLVPRSIVQASAFFQDACSKGHEGLMAKAMSSPYTPGTRGKSWLKIKFADTLDVVILAADWGYGRRHNWLSNYHLGVLDEESGEYVPVGKTFKGLRDDEFQSLTERLLSIRTAERHNTVYVKPEIVVEVTYNEIQKSPHYPSEMALRFARITRIRNDKSSNQATTLQTLRELHRKELARKGEVS
ncbi:hypothetical protein AMJ40_03470 [candidate division TA06 bacterium DG_26]|uniref:Probable DNA ligase n=1 Tax=candidate division TA06 bacterium DG_26 TaxID=1703771 RepID=A0A0S7WJC0_UNCT6|nr:MAG: hypothetical protein AMJ40_03470 [candidate division TA06 bacterium DG_26]